MATLVLTFARIGGASAEAAERPPEVAAVGYQVPVEAPTGEVQVLSLGVAELPVPSLIGEAKFVHVRLAVTNSRDDRDWVVDARDQYLGLADGTTLSPGFAESNAGAGPPRLTLPRGVRGYLDLFFPVEDGADAASTSLNWLVRRGKGVIVATTTFERLPAPGSDYHHYRPSYYAGGQLLIGPLWCSPFWPSALWLRPYSRYRRYRYTAQPRGFDVFDGGTRWRYSRVPHAPGETVGSRWRGQRHDGPAVVAPPAGGGHREAEPSPSHAAWHVRVERVLPVNAEVQRAPDSPRHSWRDTSSSESSTPSSSSTSSSSSMFSSSSSSRSPDPPDPPSPSSSSSSSSPSPPTPRLHHTSTPSPPPPPSPPPAPSAPAEDSVGSRWRSRN